MTFSQPSSTYIIVELDVKQLMSSLAQTLNGMFTFVYLSMFTLLNVLLVYHPWSAF